MTAKDLLVNTWFYRQVLSNTASLHARKGPVKHSQASGKV